VRSCQKYQRESDHSTNPGLAPGAAASKLRRLERTLSTFNQNNNRLVAG